jgi:hypothetical protein
MSGSKFHVNVALAEVRHICETLSQTLQSLGHGVPRIALLFRSEQYERELGDNILVGITFPNVENCRHFHFCYPENEEVDLDAFLAEVATAIEEYGLTPEASCCRTQSYSS